MKRILTAFVFFPLFYVLNSLCPPEAFSAFACLCAVVATWELSRLARAKGLVSHWPLNCAAALVVCASFAALRSDPPEVTIPLTALVLTSLVLTLAYLFSCREQASYLESLAAALLSCSYLGLLIGHQLALRMSGGPIRGDFLIYYLFLVIWIGDAGALYTGRSLGRHKLAPRISPNKTVEGAVGSLLASVLASLGIRAWFIPQLGFFDAVALGILLNVLGQFGDLAESGLKRCAGVKDSASFIPGHGGVLDRGDSLLFAGPMLYYYYIFLIVG
jgi:phosphatidate cytidylyltransferase